MTADRQELGKIGENLAVEALCKQGYTILTRNYRCRYGEIDIIGKVSDTLAFIEVKTRRSHHYGHPEEAVTVRKQRQIIKSAQHYLAAHHLFDHDCRFDVVAVILDECKPARIRIIAAAFDLSTTW
jgi:putative endonuclease